MLLIGSLDCRKVEFVSVIGRFRLAWLLWYAYFVEAIVYRNDGLCAVRCLRSEYEAVMSVGVGNECVFYLSLLF